MVRFVAEDRIVLGWPRISGVDLGMTVFADAGRMWAGDVPFGVSSKWKRAVGFGLRIGLPEGTRNVWRPDIVFPLDGGPPTFRITFELNKFRNGFFTPQLARSRMYTWGPEHF
jgi:hypothetical protein